MLQQQADQRPRRQRQAGDLQPLARRQPLHAQRPAVVPGAAQPLPPAPAGQHDEQQLQAGFAVEAALANSTPYSSDAGDGQRPGQRVDAQVARHHPQRQREGQQFEPGDGAAQQREPAGVRAGASSARRLSITYFGA
jgi:hypothetical protein